MTRIFRNGFLSIGFLFLTANIALATDLDETNKKDQAGEGCKDKKFTPCEEGDTACEEKQANHKKKCKDHAKGEHNEDCKEHMKKHAEK